MTAYRRPLARLPLDVFEPLVAPAPCGLGSTGGRDDDEAPVPPPSGEPPLSSASDIRARICRRLLGGDGETSSGSPAVPAPAGAGRSRVSAVADADLGEEGCGDDDLRCVSGSSAEDDHEAKEFDDGDDGGGGGAVPFAASRPVSPPVDGATTAATAVVGAGAGAGSKPTRHGFGKIRTVGEILSLDAVTLMTILDPLFTAGALHCALLERSFFVLRFRFSS
jgi:hypothetical protein